MFEAGLLWFQSLSGIRCLCDAPVTPPENGILLCFNPSQGLGAFVTRLRGHFGYPSARFNPSQGLGAFVTPAAKSSPKPSLLGFNPSQGLGAFVTLSELRNAYQAYAGFNPSQGLGAFVTPPVLFGARTTE